MSFHNFEKALEMAQECKFYTTKGGTSDAVILKAEELFGYKFSRQTYEFLKKIGYMSFNGYEFFGICKDDFSGIPHGNMIEATLADRKDFNLPSEWLTIFFFDDGYYGYLDYSQLNEEGEPPVIMAIYNGEKYEVVKKVSSDFGDFIMERVERGLK
jgi:hypothetical protein